MRNVNSTTYSMIVAGVLEGLLREDDLGVDVLFKRTNITLPTWSRLSKGQSKLDLEHLYSIEKQLGYKACDVLKIAESVKQKAINDGIRIIPPIPTNSGRLTKKDGVAVVALAVLAYMAVKEIGKS